MKEKVFLYPKIRCGSNFILIFGSNFTFFENFQLIADVPSVHQKSKLIQIFSQK
uniref:Uncharacterized protein n=1 Tax=Meloidogyne enterolobii TaxID=390850 RepID=A0A6V7WM81_MELEN|nr:unnamed protein product [Meloidogyne enterolobii]